MKFWILGANPDLPDDHPFWKASNEYAVEFLIEAETESEARQIAALNCGDEGKEAWFNPELSECKELKLSGSPGVWIRHYRG